MTAVTLLCLQRTIWFDADSAVDAVEGLHVSEPSHRSESIHGDRMPTPTLEDFLSHSQTLIILISVHPVLQFIFCGAFNNIKDSPVQLIPVIDGQQYTDLFQSKRMKSYLSEIVSEK